MKTLIVYYSSSGNNEFLAKELQKRLNCEIDKIIPLKKRTQFSIILDAYFKGKSKIQKSDHHLIEFDRIILITPIYIGKIATPMKSFIEMERDNFKEYSFITICNGVPEQNRKITDELTRLAKKKPLAVTELMVNDLLPPDKKNKPSYTSAYKVQERDFQVFEKTIENFLKVSISN